MVSLGRATAQPALIVGRGARSTEALCMLRSFDRGAAGCGAETERREKLEHATGSGIPAPGMPPYDRPVTRSTWILATLLLLPACAPDVTLAPLDVPQADTAEDARAPDVGADAAALPDVAAPDASPPDVPPVDAAAPDAPADVSTPDAPEDVARDASPDVADAAPDRAVADAAPDATADVAPPCAERAVRCVGGSPEFCVSGAWGGGVVWLDCADGRDQHLRDGQLLRLPSRGVGHRLRRGAAVRRRRGLLPHGAGALRCRALRTHGYDRVRDRGRLWRVANLDDAGRLR